MKSFFKVLGFVTLGVLLTLYICFLFVLPRVVDLNQYKPMLQTLVKEQSGMDINFENAQIITTPLLGVGVKADDIIIKLPDGSILFTAAGIKTRIALPSALLFTVKISCLELENPLLNLEIDKDNVDYKIVKLVENILNSNKEKTFGEERVVTETWFNPAWIKVKVPCVKINNYKILVNDLKSGHYLDIHGEKLTAGYFNGKTAKLKTYVELYSDENKNLSINVDINTFIPKTEPKLDSEDDPAERIDITFVNPVDLYRTYDLKADIDTKLKVRERENSIISFGHLNIDGVTLKVSHLILPESYLHIKTYMHSLKLDTNIYPAREQNIQLLGKIDCGKHPKMDMNIKTTTISFNDMLILGKAFLDSLRIPNELGQFKADGQLIADCHIKTNFKKLKSNGFIKIQNGGLTVRNLGKVISDANINTILDGNALSLKDSSLYINKSKITIDGSIDNKSVVDVNVNTDKLPLPALLNAFAPKSIRNNYNLRSGDISLNTEIKGKLKEAVTNAKFNFDNLDLSDKKNTFNLKNDKLSGEFTFEAKHKAITGHIDNKEFIFRLPKTNSFLRIPNLELGIADKNIMIPENEILFNNKSKIKFNGTILNYEKLKNIELSLNGDIFTDDIIQLIGQELKPFIHSKGTLPIKLTINGDKKKQTIIAQALADRDNFITPADFTELGGKQSSLQAIIDLKPGRIKIKKTGLYIRTVDIDKDGNEIVNLDGILDIDGTIAGNRINLLKISFPKTLSGKIYAFPKSSLLNNKANIYIFGDIANPIIRGSLNIKEIRIPELLTSIDNIKLDFRDHILNFNLKDILLNGSDISVVGDLDLNVNSTLNLFALDISSREIILERMLKVAERAMKYVPSKTGSGSSTAANQDIPINIQSGSINMNRIKTGNITIANTTSRMALRRNILGLRGLRTDIFNGRVNGDIFVDLLKTAINVDLSGENINVAKAMLDAAGMKDMLSGTAEFQAKLSIDGAAQNVTEQMKGIDGSVDFTVTDGQYGPFGKIENLIIAQNIRESQFFQTALGGVINSLTQIDTTHFAELKGHLDFKEGVCHIEPITSLGNILTMHIFGDFDLIKNYADMKVRAKMSSIISNVLGPINAINPINIMNSAASLNVVTAKAFSIFCEVIPEDEFNIIPNLSNAYVDSSATKFQLVIRGDAAKPLTLIKTFKWLASKTQYDEAVEFVNSLPEEVEGSTAANIEEAIAEAKALEEEKKTLKYKVKHLFEKKNKKVEKNNRAEIPSVEE